MPRSNIVTVGHLKVDFDRLPNELYRQCVTIGLYALWMADRIPDHLIIRPMKKKSRTP